MPYDVATIPLDTSEIGKCLDLMCEGLKDVEPNPCVQAAAFALIWSVARGEELCECQDTGNDARLLELRKDWMAFIQRGMAWCAADLSTPMGGTQ